jgi:ParB family chromosome partitioning protein
MSGKNYLDQLGLGSRLHERPLPPGVEVSRIPVSAIEGDPNQPRRTFDEQKLDELAESLKRHGQLQPIRVVRAAVAGRYVVVAGERRLRASQRAGLPTIDAIVLVERASDGEIREQQLVENVIRDDLTPLEMAEAYRSLLNNWGCSQAELARRLSVNPSTVSRALALLELPAESQEQITAGVPVSKAAAPARRSAQRRPRTRTAATDKRRAATFETKAAGTIRVKRGSTLEQLVEELQAIARGEQRHAA